MYHHAGDVNECLTNNGGCEHTFTNTDGSFFCDCMSGYSLSVDGTTCDSMPGIVLIINSN